jgi:hypothetical protein
MGSCLMPAKSQVAALWWVHCELTGQPVVVMIGILHFAIVLTVDWACPASV